MCRPTTPKINFYLRKHTNKNEGWIYISFYIQREKINFSTKISCKEKDWNDEKCYVKKTDKEHSDKNLLLNNILAKINDIFVKYRLKNKQITRDGFYKGYNGVNNFTNFKIYCKEKIKIYSNFLEASTINAHHSVLKKLFEYKQEISFEELNSDFFNIYKRYLKKELKNSNSTISKNLKTIQKYTNIAIKEGFLSENPFEDVRIGTTAETNVYLTEKELTRFIQYYKNNDFEYSNEKKTLQIFLFMCFSSLHISDAKNLRIENFNKYELTYFRKKNRNVKPVPITIPINNSLIWILQEIIKDRTKGTIFIKYPADQTINKTLKLIAKTLNINKNISCKVARHTFATIYLSKTHDLNSLKELLGHSSISQTIRYAHVLEKNKVEGVKCFDKFMG